MTVRQVDGFLLQVLLALRLHDHARAATAVSERGDGGGEGEYIGSGGPTILPLFLGGEDATAAAVASRHGAFPLEKLPTLSPLPSIATATAAAAALRAAGVPVPVSFLRLSVRAAVERLAALPGLHLDRAAPAPAGAEGAARTAAAAIVAAVAAEARTESARGLRETARSAVTVDGGPLAATPSRGGRAGEYRSDSDDGSDGGRDREAEKMRRWQQQQQQVQATARRQAAGEAGRAAWRERLAAGRLWRQHFEALGLGDRAEEMAWQVSLQRGMRAHVRTYVCMCGACVRACLHTCVCVRACLNQCAGLCASHPHARRQPRPKMQRTVIARELAETHRAAMLSYETHRAAMLSHPSH